MWKFYQFFDPDNKLIKIGITAKPIEQRKKELLKLWQTFNTTKFILLTEIPLKTKLQAKCFEALQREKLDGIKCCRRMRPSHDWYKFDSSKI